MAWLSCMCCEEKVPFFRPKTFTSSRAIPTTSKTELISRVCIISAAKVSKIFDKQGATPVVLR